MEKKIAIVTDTACDLPDELIERYDIRLLPLRVIWKGKDMRDRVELDSNVIYDMMDEEIPTTSLPHYDDFAELIESLKAEGYTDVLIETISSRLSGTNNAVRLWMKDVTGIDITLYDTYSLSMGQGACVLEAAKIIRAGGTIEQATARSDEVRRTEGAYYTVDTLEYLRKGGRIGVVEGTLGTLLQIRPVITVDAAGNFKSVSKSKGRKRAAANMVQLIRDSFTGKRIFLAAIHGADPEGANYLASIVRTFADVVEFCRVQLCPTMAIHTGRGLLGLIAYELAY